MTPARERKAAQRARARSAGLCTSCCSAQARPGRAYCQPCADASYARVKAARIAQEASK